MQQSILDAEGLISSYELTRNQTSLLCQPLEIDDYGVQPMERASPPKWHLAHTSWFFEAFLLKPYMQEYQVFHDEFAFLFNSYYESIGARHPRPQRGNLSRPTVEEIYRYRQYVDEHMIALISAGLDEDAKSRVILGLHHEEQHQELLLTDLKFNLGHNPLRPAYRQQAESTARMAAPMKFLEMPACVAEIGIESDTESFCFDNETPKHQVLLPPFKIGSRLVTNGEFLEFISDGGYDTPSLWLSDGWNERQISRWESPEYWTRRDGTWREYTLFGERNLDEHAPVTHLSLYEADAYAKWSGARLPTEYEWESAANQVDSVIPHETKLHPAPAQSQEKIDQLHGDCWQWTLSAYLPYPRHKPLEGALGEYNSKFMSNQYVLRGSACVTPINHARNTYRNFFYAKDRWQFSGIRLVHDFQ